ncbi:LOW QUALITY PROTEIN: acrosin [Tamandua tetradactyla]|uniref:LOW QUALITY PROTEIN: acrosin n=1 Tax=Tamandua tetradactyla TaxID=48850 RepID=UPI004054480A
MVEMVPTAVLLVLATSVAARNNDTCDGPCGLRFRQNLPGSVRVVGGQASVPGAWPWMVSVQVFTYHNSRRYHTCGGILLNAHWVLSAAHCFKDKDKVNQWRLIFGAREVLSGSNAPVRPPAQERFVEKIIVHEKYGNRLKMNDIALLKVTPPVSCGAFVGQACLPPFKAGPPTIPQACWVAGWGFLREQGSQPASLLQEARVVLIDLDLCNSTEWYNGRISTTNVCAGYPEGKIDTCQGDSGGPLMCKDNVENVYMVVGITSWGVGCARAKRPGVYTSTWHYLDWIASKIGSSALHTAQPTTTAPTTTRPHPPRPTPARLPSTRPWYYQHPPGPPPQPRPPPPPPPRPPPPPPPPLPPPPPPPPTKTMQGLSFPKRLRLLIATLKKKSSFDVRASYDLEAADHPDLTPSS